MAPARSAAKSRAAKASKQVKASSECSQEIIEEGDLSADSEEMATLRIQRLAETMKQSARKRREARRKAVEADFLRRSERLEKQISSAFGEYEKSKSTKARLEQLAALLKRKTLIEEKIVVRLTKLEKAYTDASKEFSVTLVGRSEDIRKLAKPL